MTAHSSAAVELVERVLRANGTLWRLLEAVESIGLPSWYVGAAAVAQSVWNDVHGFDPAQGIGDYDVVYFDPDDLGGEAEQSLERALAGLVPTGEARVDVTNEARVHTWYPERFGRAIAPYRSVEEAIATWPTTATAVGVRLEDSRLVVHAPFGLGDLVGLVVRPNKAIVSREVYEQKAARWAALWPRLSVIPWDSA